MRIKMHLDKLYDPLSRDILFFRADSLTDCISLVGEHLRSDIPGRKKYAEDVRDSLKETFSSIPELFDFFSKRGLDFNLYLSRVEDYHKKGWKTEGLVRELYKEVHYFKRGIFEELYPNKNK